MAPSRRHPAEDHPPYNGIPSLPKKENTISYPVPPPPQIWLGPLTSQLVSMALLLYLQDVSPVAATITSSPHFPCVVKARLT